MPTSLLDQFRGLHRAVERSDFAALTEAAGALRHQFLSLAAAVNAATAPLAAVALAVRSAPPLPLPSLL